jgi:anti-anti-sigma regulatory factor
MTHRPPEPLLSARLVDDPFSCVVALTGELDLSTRDELALVGDAVPACCRRLVLELSGLTFLDIAGARAFINLAERMDVVSLTGAPPWIARVLTLLDMEQRLTLPMSSAS